MKANVTLTLAVIALGLGVAATGGVVYLWFFRDRPANESVEVLGKGLDKYDFSTPTAALKSEYQMQDNVDLRALLELQRRTRSAETKERRDTLVVKLEVDWQGKKIVFFSYLKAGKTQHACVGFEKHAESGFWTQKSISPFDVETDNKELAEMMRSWQSRGTLEPNKPTK